MSADIIDFTARRAEKKKAAVPPTLADIVANATDFLLGDWEKMARNNRLNDYFKQSLPKIIDQTTKVNYMSDLNEIAGLELNLELFPMIFFPGTIRRQQLGWIVQFKLGGETVSTPELATEAYTRCFNILLYLKVKRDALDMGVLK